MTAESEADTRRMLDNTAALVRSLSDYLQWQHPDSRVEVLQTHISWVVLGGSLAYKIKKPVNFGFLDFSTLERRHHYCVEEIRLNRRFAPRIYREVIAIRGSISAPWLQGEGPVIEYAVCMNQFPQDALLSAHAAASTLTRPIIDDIALRVSELHASSEQKPPGSDYGSASRVHQWSEENLLQLAKIPQAALHEAYAGLRRWYRDYPDLTQQLEQRLADGHVRDCHGDLHLGNMALIDGRVTAFDCIEFNPDLRWIDTISEAAFIAMDLEARGFPGYCWRFISRYLENSADYDAIALLRYYVVYRALVRAKVEALSVAPDLQIDATAFKPALAYIQLADRWTTRHGTGLVIMHGLSGSGKSTIAAALVESLQAIQFRSDVVRKQLFDLAADADSGSAAGQGIYSSEATIATYQRLRQIASQAVAAGFIAIIDATSLLRSQRSILLELTATARCPCVVVDCNAPLEVLRSRISARRNDPSEATLDILEGQRKQHEPVTMDESGIDAIVTIGAAGLQLDHIERLGRLLTA